VLRVNVGTASLNVTLRNKLFDIVFRLREGGGGVLVVSWRVKFRRAGVLVFVCEVCCRCHCLHHDDHDHHQLRCNLMGLRQLLNYVQQYVCLL
jgi:hypothetical protein